MKTGFADVACLRLRIRRRGRGRPILLIAGIGANLDVAHPALVVAGDDDDPVVPPTNARLLAWRLPDARLHVVKGGGHPFLLDQPHGLAGELTAFLDHAS